jgi:hypothetical protein
MPDIRLYLVKADLTHIHDFDVAAVYATSPEDAVAVTEATIAQYEADYASGVVSPVEGTWETLYVGATLTATEVPAVRGPVLGHATPC